MIKPTAILPHPTRPKPARRKPPSSTFYKKSDIWWVSYLISICLNFETNLDGVMNQMVRRVLHRSWEQRWSWRLEQVKQWHRRYIIISQISQPLTVVNFVRLLKNRLKNQMNKLFLLICSVLRFLLRKSKANWRIQNIWSSVRAELTNLHRKRILHLLEITNSAIW